MSKQSAELKEGYLNILRKIKTHNEELFDRFCNHLDYSEYKEALKLIVDECNKADYFSYSEQRDIDSFRSYFLYLLVEEEGYDYLDTLKDVLKNYNGSVFTNFLNVYFDNKPVVELNSDLLQKYNISSRWDIFDFTCGTLKSDLDVQLKGITCNDFISSSDSIRCSDFPTTSNSITLTVPNTEILRVDIAKPLNKIDLSNCVNLQMINEDTLVNIKEEIRLPEIKSPDKDIRLFIKEGTKLPPDLKIYRKKGTRIGIGVTTTQIYDPETRSKVKTQYCDLLKPHIITE